MKMQNVSFRSYEECLDYIPKNEQELLERLDDLIRSTLPQIKRKLSYNVPFYYQQKNICYVWPGAVPWGRVTFPGVQLGFTQGHKLFDETAYLLTQNRKYVRTRQFNSLREEDEDMIRYFLLQAEEIDRRR